jgi:hypothetical protein
VLEHLQLPSYNELLKTEDSNMKEGLAIQTKLCLGSLGSWYNRIAKSEEEQKSTNSSFNIKKEKAITTRELAVVEDGGPMLAHGPSAGRRRILTHAKARGCRRGSKGRLKNLGDVFSFSLTGDGLH